jgi:hypothetical protein
MFFFWPVFVVPDSVLLPHILGVARYLRMSLNQCLILFVRFPERGKVKTRLAKDIGPQKAKVLYTYFVLDLLKTLNRDDLSITICFSPPGAGEDMKKWLGKRYSYMPQNGEDLGKRMKNAFEDVFRKDFREAVLIGTDIPDISDSIIEDAFYLDKHDAVIGPSYDGGYYLIGFRKDTFLPGIFDEIAWGTERVFEKTMEIFTKNTYAVRTLSVWQDVDRLADLKALYQRNITTPFAESKTMLYLSQNLNLIR